MSHGRVFSPWQRLVQGCRMLLLGMACMLVMGVAPMYLILVVQFGSFTAPLAVMVSLPLSLVGVVLALLMVVPPV